MLTSVILIAGGLAPTGASRIDRNNINQSGVRWALVFEMIIIVINICIT